MKRNGLEGERKRKRTRNPNITTGPSKLLLREMKRKKKKKDESTIDDSTSRTKERGVRVP